MSAGIGFIIGIVIFVGIIGYSALIVGARADNDEYRAAKGKGSQNNKVLEGKDD